MRKNKVVPKPEPPVRDGVSIRVRFASHVQIELIARAAVRRGIPRDLFIQDVLQAASEYILSQPPAPAIAEITKELLANRLSNHS